MSRDFSLHQLVEIHLSLQSTLASLKVPTANVTRGDTVVLLSPNWLNSTFQPSRDPNAFEARHELNWMEKVEMTFPERDLTFFCDRLKAGLCEEEEGKGKKNPV